MRFPLVVLLLATACGELQFGVKPPATQPSKGKSELPIFQDANRGLVPEPDATLAQICLDDGLLLSRFDVHTLKHRLAAVCCSDDGDGLSPGHPRCNTPWPAPEPFPCSRWLELQAQLLGRYGFIFENPETQAYFEAQPWYRADGSFATNSLAITAKRNWASLDRFHRDSIDCVPQKPARKKK